MTFYDGIIAIATVLAPLALAVVVYLTGGEVSRSAERAAIAVERVETSLARSDLQNEYKLDQIHMLVNSRLTEALAKIDSLEARLFAATGEQPTGEPPRVTAP